MQHKAHSSPWKKENKLVLTTHKQAFEEQQPQKSNPLNHLDDLYSTTSVPPVHNIGRHEKKKNPTTTIEKKTSTTRHTTQLDEKEQRILLLEFRRRSHRKMKMMMNTHNKPCTRVLGWCRFPKSVACSFPIVWRSKTGEPRRLARSLYLPLSL